MISKPWKKSLRIASRAGGIAVIVFLGAVLVVPFPKERLEKFPASVILADREGHPLRVQLGPHDLDCRPTFQPEREDWIAKAMVAAEDQRFWSHPGIDPMAMARAVKQNVFSLRKVSGASTLSTQVIRLVDQRPRTLWSKCVEAFRALQLECTLSKEEILAQYLNRAPFGSNLVGIEATSRRYFGKGPENLSLAEAALLAGLPQSPTRLRPDKHFAAAKKRQAYVLERMVACGFISEQERADAMAQSLAVRPSPYPFLAPHFCEMLDDVDWRRADPSPSGRRGVTPSPSVVRTTLDPALQRVAEEALKRNAATLAQGDIRGGAVVILDVKTGAVRAMVGSPDFFDTKNKGQVNAALAPRSAGSTLKPFAYAMAMDRGLITPQTVLGDVPKLYSDYQPGNFDESFRGLVTARDALILSLNMPAIDVEHRVGQPLFCDTLKKLGLSTISKPAEHYGLGLVIGNGEVRLLDLANAYACLARGGKYFPPTILECAGAPALSNDSPAAMKSGGAPPHSKLFSPEACWLIAEALSGDERAMDATGNAADVRLPPLAWKTGTSAGFHDAWTIAFNPQYVIGVWAGNPDGAPSEQLVGKKVATPIVWEIFRRLYPDNDGPWFERPAGLKHREVCAESGCPPGAHCRHRIDDWYIEGVSGFQTCAIHARGEDEVWPPEIAAFLNKQKAVPKTPTAKIAQLRITSPAPGSTFHLLDGMAVDNQRVPLIAASSAAGQRLHWFVNDRYLGEAAVGANLFWPLARGKFQIVCCDAAGRCDRVQIAVE